MIDSNVVVVCAAAVGHVDVVDAFVVYDEQMPQRHSSTSMLQQEILVSILSIPP